MHSWSAGIVVPTGPDVMLEACAVRYTPAMVRSLFAVLAALSLAGCIIVTDDPDDDDGAADETGASTEGDAPACGDPGTFSFEDDMGTCNCEEGLTWCTTDDNDFTCCLPTCGDSGTNSQVVEGDQCQCLPGYEWCTDDPDDINCC